jgi:acetyl esterase/lipase
MCSGEDQPFPRVPEMIMRISTLAAIALSFLTSAPAFAQVKPSDIEPITPLAEPEAIPLYGRDTPGKADTETWLKYLGRDYVVRNVTHPTLTPILPDPAKATGAAVIVAPGGGFMLLAIDPEGWRVAHALADRGIAAFVLKYRIMSTPVDVVAADTFMNERIREGLPDPFQQPTLQYPLATEDALAALALVRANSAKWNVDPKRVGMIGFSAGAMTALNVVISARRGKGPDFFGYIYGPQAKVAVPADAPPMFAAIAFDDPIFPTIGFPIVEAWRKAERPVELHAYGRGGHGFGLGAPQTTTLGMLDQFVAWMDMQGMLNKPVDVKR